MKVLHFLFRVSKSPKDNTRAIQELIRSIRTPNVPEVTITALRPPHGPDSEARVLPRSEAGATRELPGPADISGIALRGDPEGIEVLRDRLRIVLRRADIGFTEEFGEDVTPQQEWGRDTSEPVEGFKNVERYGVYGFARYTAEATVHDKAAWEKQRALQSGIRFYHLGLHEDAERQLKRVIKGKNGSPEAFHFLGLVYEQLEKLEQAAKALKRSIELDGEGAASYFYLANIEQKLGHLPPAIENYKKAIERDPDVPVIYNNLGWVYYQKGEHERALKAFEEAISMDPDLPFAHNGLACVYQDTGNLAEAVNEFKQAIELFPGYAAAHLKLGWSYLLTGDVGSAIDSLKTAVQSSDDPQYTVSAQYSLGHAYMSQNQLTSAYEAFDSVVADDPDFIEAHYHAAEALVRLSRYGEAIPRLLDYAQKSTENRTDTYKLLATSYFHLHRYKDAGAAARSALKLDPEDLELQELLGNLASVQGRWKEAEKIFKSVLEKEAGSAFSHFQMGWVYENTQRVKESIEEYKKSIQLDPEATEAYNNLGWLYTEQGKKEEALVIFEKAIELNPRDVDLINNLGWTYSIMGNYNEALEQYQKGLSMSPSSSLLNANLGTVYYKMGRFPEAVFALERSLELEGDPSDHAVAHYFLGLIARRDAEPARAAQHFQAAVQLDPDYPEPYFPLGEWLAGQGKRQKAMAALKQYLQLNPQGEFAAQAQALLTRPKTSKS